jgi:hypothetical protein
VVIQNTTSQKQRVLENKVELWQSPRKRVIVEILLAARQMSTRDPGKGCQSQTMSIKSGTSFSLASEKRSNLQNLTLIDCDNLPVSEDAQPGSVDRS